MMLQKRYCEVNLSRGSTRLVERRTSSRGVNSHFKQRSDPSSEHRTEGQAEGAANRITCNHDKRREGWNKGSATALCNKCWVWWANKRGKFNDHSSAIGLGLALPATRFRRSVLVSAWTAVCLLYGGCSTKVDVGLRVWLCLSTHENLFMEDNLQKTIWGKEHVLIYAFQFMGSVESINARPMHLELLLRTFKST